MKFNHFHLMPWTEIEEADNDWPVADKKFVPERATGLYNTYVDTMAMPRSAASIGSAATSIISALTG